MRRRISLMLGLALATTFAVVGLSAQANATTPVLYKQFNFPDACSSAGFAGEQAGQWTWYQCDVIFAAGPGDTFPGLYDLYVIPA